MADEQLHQQIVRVLIANGMVDPNHGLLYRTAPPPLPGMLRVACFCHPSVPVVPCYLHDYLEAAAASLKGSPAPRNSGAESRIN